MDVRYALRILWKSPAFTLVALVTLMLGIGANVVVFGVVNAVLLHPLDVSDPQNLYQLRLKPWVVSLIWWKSAEGVIIRCSCSQKRLRPLAGGLRRMTPCRTIAGLG